MSSQVVQPGRDLIEVARALELIGRSTGRFPYQWLRPGPNSKVVMRQAAIAITGVAATVQTIVEYTVPDGMRFSLTGFIVGFGGTGWTPGSADLLFTLSCVSAGSRPVDDMNNLAFPFGSFNQGPFPIAARLEFQPSDILRWTVTEDGTVLPGAGQDAIAMIYGHEYPQDEAVAI